VFVLDAAGKEIFTYRPRRGDLTSCQQMVDVLHAVKERSAPPPTAAGVQSL
jgi:hypothetical protein